MSLHYLNHVEVDGLSRLLERGVAFVIVGSHALLHYTPLERPNGGLRTIGDLDIFVECSATNLERLSLALSGPGWDCPPDVVIATLREGRSFNITRYQIQFIPVLSGVEWTDVFRTAERVYSLAGTVPVISREMLIINKKAAGRPKDLDDVRVLESDGITNAA